MNNELIVKINPTEIFQTQNEGKDFIVNPDAENANEQRVNSKN
nr:MAG TPA: hypothetical protein [Caudoviricetes sp.]